MLTGVYAARNISGESLDVWSVNTENEYHEEREIGSSVSGDRLVPARPRVKIADQARLPQVLLEETLNRMDPVALGSAIGLVCGLGVFLATAILLLRGDEGIGVYLMLLNNYFVGFGLTWAGAFIGFLEAAIGGFVVGFTGAYVRNLGVEAYAYLVRQAQMDADQ